MKNFNLWHFIKSNSFAPNQNDVYSFLLPSDKSFFLKDFKLAVFILGMSAIFSQTVLIREFLSVFYGNELVIGAILCNWMLLTALGAFLGRYFNFRIKNSRKFVLISLIVLGVLPILIVFLLDYYKNVIFPEGSMLGFFQILASSFVLLLPFCVLSGSVFTTLAKLISHTCLSNQINKTYACESLGSVIGGALFNFILVFLLSSVQCLQVMMCINFLAVFYFSLHWRYNYYYVILSWVILIGGIVSFGINGDQLMKKYLFKGQTLIFQKGTPYGNLVVTQTGEQLNFYENNVLLFNTANMIENEENTHYAMVQRPDSRKVLLVSGGISGICSEIFKYPVNRIDYVEINPWIIQVGRHFTHSLNHRGIHVINQDARLYIKRAPVLYDVALINLPEPGTSEINRYYTVEFLKELKSKLLPGAVVSYRLMSTSDYVSREAADLNSVLYNTLKTAFKNVLIIPGMKNYFIASDKPLSLKVAHLVDSLKISNLYVNKYYIEDELLAQRSHYILRKIDQNAPANKDFIPVSCYRQTLYWLSYFKVNLWVILSFLFVLMIIVYWRLNAVNITMFSGGFAAASLEFALILAFQILYGYVFQMTGVIITLFMAGLALGAFYRHRIIAEVNRKTMLQIQLMIALYALLMPMVVFFFRQINIHVVLIHLLFFILTLIIAVLVGMEFSMASIFQKGEYGKVAGSLYSADSLGSAFGILLASVFLIPWLGMFKFGMTVCLLNALSGLFFIMKTRK